MATYKGKALRWDQAIIVDYPTLISYKGVSAVGVGLKEVQGTLTRKRCVRIYVRKKLATGECDEALPKSTRVLVPIGGGHYITRRLPTDVIHLSRVRLAAGPLNPVPVGAQVQRRGGGRGTAGLPVRRAGQLFMLTAAHVLKVPFGRSLPSNPSARIDVFQPSVLPIPRWRFGAVQGAIHGSSSTKGAIDAGLIRPQGRALTSKSVLGKLTRPGPPLPARACLGLKVHKEGAKTKHTVGICGSQPIAVRIPEGPNGHLYHGVLDVKGEGGVFAQKGDSGAVVLSRDPNSVGRVVGILFAAGNDGRGFVIPFGRIASALGIRIANV